MKKSNATRLIALANQKGGSGKTTTAINLGACLSEMGRRTLLIDLDPQANSTIGLGIDPDGLSRSIYDVLVRADADLECAIVKNAVERMDLAPARLDLSGAEVELVNTIGREIILAEKVLDVEEDYDYILLDCPPSLGLLTLNAMTTAHEVILPVQAHFFALEGMSRLLNTIEIVKTRLNPELRLSGILPTIYQTGTKLCERVVEELRSHFDGQVFDTVIHSNIRLAEAPSHGLPIILYDPDSRGARDYRTFAREVEAIEE